MLFAEMIKQAFADREHHMNRIRELEDTIDSLRITLEDRKGEMQTAIEEDDLGAYLKAKKQIPELKDDISNLEAQVKRLRESPTMIPTDLREDLITAYNNADRFAENAINVILDDIREMARMVYNYEAQARSALSNNLEDVDRLTNRTRKVMEKIHE